jgi:nucleoid DNA-binding protein
MTTRIQKQEIVQRTALKLSEDEKQIEAHFDAILETLYEAFKAGESIILTSFGSFYVRPGRDPGLLSSIPAKN